MKELQDIVDAYNKAVAEGTQMALATVVHVEGSSYRRPGARMLVTEDGKLTGAISGGCLEGDARRKAQMVMAWQKPMVVTYDTTDEDDVKLGVGLGCNGIIHILIEPVDTSDAANPVQLIKSVIEKRRLAVLVTVFSLTDKRSENQRTCLLLTENRNITADPLNNPIRDELIADAKQAFQNKTPAIKSYDTYELNSLIDVIEPAISLVIAGGGNDAIPLMKFAAVLGWQITVADGRPYCATPERFPLANKVIVCRPDQALSEIMVDERTAVVMITHNYNYDLAVLKQCLVKRPGFAGVLGPKKKMERMLHELQQEGLEPAGEQSETIYGPVGLDIGAETSEEIALSIIAEIKAAFSNRPGTSLRDKIKPIHAQQLPVTGFKTSLT